jgi:hypothetical protein
MEPSVAVLRHSASRSLGPSGQLNGRYVTGIHPDRPILVALKLRRSRRPPELRRLILIALDHPLAGQTCRRRERHKRP